MKIKTNILELIKTLIIILLLIFLCLNTYRLFIQNTNSTRLVKTIDTINVESRNYIKPYKIRFSSGNQNYIIYNDLDKKLCDGLSKYFVEILSKPYKIEEVSDIYKQSKSLNMLVFSFNSKINKSLFTLNNNQEQLAENNINYIKDIYFIADKNLKLIVNTGEKFYIVIPENESLISVKIPINNFKQRIKEIILSSSIRYKELEYLISGDRFKSYDNKTFFVCRGYYAPKFYELLPEYDFADSAVCNDLVNKIFEAKSPFVKEAENKDGDKIYLSEYGSDILKLSSNGKIDYKLETGSGRKITKLEEDFATALKFDLKISQENSNIRLDKIKEKKKGDFFERTFYFSKNDKIGMIYSNFEKNGISIVVNGGKIAEYNRYLPVVKEKLNSDNQIKGITYDQKTVISIIKNKKNFSGLKKLYLKNKPNTKKNYNLKQEDILKGIKSIDYGYYEAYKNNIRPCYVIKIEDSSFIIDFYSGEGVIDELG